MKPALQFQLPRLYVFIIVIAILFSVLNVVVLFYGRNLFLYFQAIWSWAGILLIALLGAMIIGMFLSYRMLAFREFTPFEREMMEMRLEVDECRELLSQIKERLQDLEYSPPSDRPEREVGGPEED
jgi:cytochrome c biogenesis protein CcdA